MDSLRQDSLCVGVHWTHSVDCSFERSYRDTPVAHCRYDVPWTPPEPWVGGVSSPETSVRGTGPRPVHDYS